MAAVYPLSPSRQHLVELAVSPEFQSAMHGLPTDAFVDGLIRPVRAITDRQGKGWRSMGLLLAAAVVGGEPSVLERFSSFPEFLHTGSLIIDDIQVIAQSSWKAWCGLRLDWRKVVPSWFELVSTVVDRIPPVMPAIPIDGRSGLPTLPFHLPLMPLRYAGAMTANALCSLHSQDNSLLRRGGPCAHITYGVATAINAGTAAYFLGEGITRDHPLTNAQRLRVYELYFTCLRGSHVGQVRNSSPNY